MSTKVRELPDVEVLRVTSVRVAGERALWLRFSDGVEGVVSLARRLRGPVFEPLRDPRFFARVRVEDEYTVGWPGGIDLAPEYLYRLVVPSGRARKRNLARANDASEREYLAQVDRMPEVSRFFGIVIRMFWSEHAHPHFHARYGKRGARIAIGAGDVVTHRFPPRALQFVLEWRDLHKSELLENWDRMRRGLSPNRIAPLDSSRGLGSLHSRRHRPQRAARAHA